MPTANRANHTKAVGSPLSFACFALFAVDQRTTTGNLTSDSLWTNVWNGEARRITIESRSTLTAAGKLKEQWTHLADGRWIERIVSTNNGTSYYPALTNRYVWDGQILLAVLDHTNGLVLSFVRGLDLSGSIQGAGGVGGVLAVKAGTSVQCSAMANTTHFTCYDGNGNVAALVNAATGVESARYETGPFAEPLRMTGPMAKLNPIRFSTQYHDDFTGDDKYVFRDLSDGRWLNRDPINEPGFKILNRSRKSFDRDEEMNLYRFVKNDSMNHIDYLGNACDGKCGPEVSEGVYKTLRDVEKQFKALSPDAQKSACSKLHLVAVWDIIFPSPPKGCATECCEDTYSFLGKCYWMWDINYILFGKISQLCDFDENTMQLMVLGQKVILKPIQKAACLQNGFGEYTQTVFGFTQLGYNIEEGTSEFPSFVDLPNGKRSTCKPCDSKEAKSSTYKNAFQTSWPNN